jgi:hypothetical protein
MREWMADVNEGFVQNVCALMLQLHLMFSAFVLYLYIF